MIINSILLCNVIQVKRIYYINEIIFIIYNIYNIVKSNITSNIIV